MKSILIITIVLLACIAFSEALRCFSHSTCSTNCPQLANTIHTCDGDNDKCYKAAFPGGVSRGCAKQQCNVQVNANAMMANVCCESDLCNSAVQFKLTLSTLFIMLCASIWARM